MTTETTAQEAQTVATTVEQTILQMSPELIAALAVSDPQAAAVAAVVDGVAIPIISDALKQLATGKTTSAEMVKLVNQTAANIQQTHETWAKFAASEGVPETPAA